MSEEINIPKHWQSKKIGEVCQVVTGTTPSKNIKEFYGCDFPFYKPTDLEQGVNTISSRDGLTVLGLKNGRSLPEKSILVTCIGATIGKTGLIKKSGSCNQQINAVLPNEMFSPTFLYYQIISKDFQHQIVSNASSTTLPILNKSKFEKLNIVVPPIQEQHSIVSKIEELLSDLENGKQQLKLAQQQLKIYRQSLLKWAFEGKLTNKDVKDGELPKRWRVLKLKDITLEKEGLRRGPFGSAIKKEFFVPDGYKVYEQSNAIKNDSYIGNYFVSEEKYKELINFKVIPFDLIVSCSGSLGRITEIPINAKSGIINQALLRIRLKKDIISNNLFIQQFRSSQFQKKIFDQSQGTAMTNLVSIKDFKEIEMTVPPIEEQEYFLLELESKLTVCDKIEETISQSLLQAESLRQSILKKAFEGKLI